MPNTAFRGVRSSWETTDKKGDFANDTISSGGADDDVDDDVVDGLVHIVDDDVDGVRQKRARRCGPEGERMQMLSLGEG